MVVYRTPQPAGEQAASPIAIAKVLRELVRELHACAPLAYPGFWYSVYV